MLCLSRLWVCRVAAAFVLICLTPHTNGAQTAPAQIAGEYTGALGQLRLKLHLVADGAGKMSGTLDSLDQGAMGLPCSDFSQDGQRLSFAVPSVHGTWKGTVSSDGKSLTGTWNQGSPMPLAFTRDTFVAATKASPVDGIWLGTLAAGSASLRVQLHVKSSQEGEEFCTFDSIDQRAMGIGCANAHLAAGAFSFDVPAVKGRWEGRLASDGNTLMGTWNQGSPMPLTFTRQAVALAPPPLPPPPAVVYDPALKPVKEAEIEAVLTRDVAAALKDGELSPSTGAGISIGVVEHGVRHVFSFGSAKPDAIFEIGSITKTFTGLVLAQMVGQGKVKLDEPVRALLPSGTVAKPDGPEITLVDLATQHSGLPRMPDNFAPADGTNPYVDYHADNMYAYIAKRGVGRPADAGYLYSNLGFGLLGLALADRAGLSYPELLKREVLEPLELKDTVITLSPEQQARFIPGHTGSHEAAHAWDLDAFAGAGAIRSTAGDMLTYVEANLHPDALRIGVKSAAASTLPAALTASHQLRADAFGGQRIALAWHFDPATGNYWHNGATGGYSSYSFFNPKGDYAAVVLLNTTLGNNGSFADRVGEHISERLAGKPAISLAK